MRNLKTSDLFSLSRILKKMNIKDELKRLAANITGTPKERKKAEKELEIDMIMLFIENISNAEQETYKFLADLSGKTPQEISEQAPKETISMIKEVFSKEGFNDFLSLASK
ncbi:hypothetical protein BJV85_000100 [Clostridium acetobutylicum]|uniref:Uncharacterized protein n=1 Tax=Clostridium acetobutylicum (strain ATCC 824 / DSM 792 / JCM 1419 / IAM 19013 / LMG 5710 / NBRC 13948 / NRRL B-527 / VKM B-1787 / 2291 / W) TaxID=272562 RepID=Q97MY2_CLOAB|nr:MULTISPECIES: hypothetical protein [Clostridium]AAK78044.1 Hypothetical protein CA_C0058 [Clostridium acetobutylicum ATCC 824]ADZ19100.1 Conserved hypothetical protein [Clostridium acetobutylicum EA 2018]AEI31040.1 hypothetical protein SMB_G0058 [Clostridium acetobutylicum DSM 1731]AWV81893.1 hypothetical protein DK921_17765 [Clostridium acetobutylicum]MBC2395443.1 hypothetical protein [Clostridium acetobutylicum]